MHLQGQDSECAALPTIASVVGVVTTASTTAPAATEHLPRANEFHASKC